MGLSNGDRLCKRTNKRETAEERRDRLDARRRQQRAIPPGRRWFWKATGADGSGPYRNPARV